MYQVHKDPLTKKFVCKHCGEAKRTRQGLSGHIQFKHSTGKETQQQIDAAYLSSKVLDIKIWEETCGLPESTMQATRTALLTWLYAKMFCDIIGIDLNKQDFKNYLMAGLASVYQNESLKEELLASIRTLFQQAIEDYIP